MTRVEKPEELGPFQFAILTLSLLLLAALAAELLLPVPPEVKRLIGYIDVAVCVVFMADFLQRFFRAPSKLLFMKWGWIDLLASIPVIHALRWGRVFRLFRIVRLLLAVSSFRRLAGIFFASRARAGLASVFTLTFVIASFSSIAILICEHGDRANIKTADEALWWSLVTITTVGYGDFYPVTTAGRVVAAFTMFAGVGIFGAMSGVVASLILGPAKREDDDLLGEIRALRTEVEGLRDGRVAPPTPPSQS